MVWFKVDDGFYTSKKVLSIPRTARLAAVGLWTLAGNWSGRELTDGVVPNYVLTELGATPRLRRALVEARLWLDRGSDGIEFYSWGDYQPTRAEVEAERAKTAERQRRYREAQKAKTGDSAVSNGVTDAVSHGVRLGAPTRPDPTRPIDTQDRYTNPPLVVARDEDDLDPVLASVVEAVAGMGLSLHPMCAADVVAFIDGRRRRSAEPPKVPTRYYADAVRGSWPEVEKFIHERGLVA